MHIPAPIKVITDSKLMKCKEIPHYFCLAFGSRLTLKIRLMHSTLRIGRLFNVMCSIFQAIPND